jgi:hypothetical protein
MVGPDERSPGKPHAGCIALSDYRLAIVIEKPRFVYNDLPTVT